MTISTAYWLGVCTGIISGAFLMAAVVFGMMARQSHALRHWDQCEVLAESGER